MNVLLGIMTDKLPAIVALTCVLVSCGYIGVRNELTLRFLASLSDKVFSFDDWEWRCDELTKVSYWKVLFSFKPLKVSSFWEDTSFVEEINADA